ncbi:MAG: peptidylprolyl isomerase [Bacteroidetes bacterium]|nr:peptidylprolyl isomerase [Bacteroidota bacterium]
MKQLFSLGAAVLIAAQFITACSSVPDSVLARVGNDTLRVPEYEEMFLRTRFSPPVDMAEREAFLETFINYKLKLQEAAAEGLAERPEFVDDVRRYRDQLALTFLYQRELAEPGTHRLYDRRLEEVELQHILIKYIKDDRGEIDTLSTRAKAEEIFAMVRKGTVSFDSLLMRYSDDGSKERTRGVLGWFIAGTTYPELDDMMYAAKPGDVAPHLLKTVFGYHIFRLLDRKPARQRVRAAHILARLDLNNPNDTAAASAAQTLVLDSLRRGLATFEDLARRNSQDSLSGPLGGDLGWMNRGTNIEPRFEEALFGLKVGEVSNVVRTAFGMHIIKLLDEEPPLPYAEQKDHLRGVYNNERFQTDLANYLEHLRKKYEFTVNRNVINIILSHVDSTVTTSTPGWERRLRPEDLNAYLFRLSFGPVAVREVIAFSKTEGSVQMRRITAGLLDTLCTMAANRVTALHETEGFEERIPEFRRLLQEYRESSMITALEDREVWDKVKSDEAGMKAWFEQHREQFRFPDRVRFAVLFTYTKPYADGYLDSLAAGADFEDLTARQSQRPGYFMRNGAWEFVDVEANKLSQTAAKLRLGEVAGPISYEDGFCLIKLLERQGAREKTWEEARAEIVPQFKELQAEELRAAWLRGLREKFGVEVWEDHVSKTFAPKEGEKEN